MVVVFDADVLIPMILEASRSTRLFLRLTTAGHTIALSQPIFEEVAEKLRTSKTLRAWLGVPEKLSDQDIETFLKGLPTVCRVTAGDVTVQGVVTDDPDDDKVLAAGRESGASYLISEDKHLRRLGQWHGIEIMSRQEFEAELDRLGVAPLQQKRKRKGKK